MLLVCWRMWLTGWVACLVRFKKATRVPKVRLLWPERASSAPTAAHSTLLMLPRLPLTGMAMLAKVLALSALSRRDWFSWRKSSRLFSSWQNTLTTFWPAIISSM